MSKDKHSPHNHHPQDNGHHTHHKMEEASHEHHVGHNYHDEQIEEGTHDHAHHHGGHGDHDHHHHGNFKEIFEILTARDYYFIAIANDGYRFALSIYLYVF